MRYLLIAGVVAFGLMLFTIVDIIITERSRVRHFPKAVWIVLAVILSLIGTALWFTIGRESPRATRRRATAPRFPLGPDDDPGFIDRLAREKEREERIRDLEQQLDDLDGRDDDKPKE